MYIYISLTDLNHHFHDTRVLCMQALFSRARRTFRATFSLTHAWWCHLSQKVTKYPINSVVQWHQAGIWRAIGIFVNLHIALPPFTWRWFILLLLWVQSIFFGEERNLAELTVDSELSFLILFDFHPDFNGVSLVSYNLFKLVCLCPFFEGRDDVGCYTLLILDKSSFLSPKIGISKTGLKTLRVFELDFSYSFFLNLAVNSDFIEFLDGFLSQESRDYLDYSD